MSTRDKRPVWLVQLPIPPLGPGEIRGNVPLAAAYLKLWAESHGLGGDFDIQLFPPRLANTLSDRALAAALAERGPSLVGFTCYVWNIERTLWIAREIKRLRPDVRIVLGGPEITADNSWVLENESYDYAVIGEGEQTFAELLASFRAGDNAVSIPGLYTPPRSGPRFDPRRAPAFRTPMPDLNALGSPYRAGILDVADEQMLLIETIRGCRFQCKFCYYPKAYDKLYFLADEAVRAELRHAAERGAEEVFLLDPTLNQRKDFADFLRLLGAANSERRFRYFGELRAEGITADTAALLRQANFTEVEVGLQSIGPQAMSLMERNNNLRAFERGVRAMLEQGIRVKVDLIVGLPGDTAESVRRGIRYLRDNGLYTEVQVFHLSILPGTAFRHEAPALGLRFQSRPPYYVLETPTLNAADIMGLLAEAQDIFEVEFDAAPAPDLRGHAGVHRVDLDVPQRSAGSNSTVQTLTLWVRARDFHQQEQRLTELIEEVLNSNPFTTLQVVLDPVDPSARVVQQTLNTDLAGRLLGACQRQPTYLDKFYSMHPGRTTGAKRLIVLLPCALHGTLADDWLDTMSDLVTIVWRDGESGSLNPDGFTGIECTVPVGN